MAIRKDTAMNTTVASTGEKAAIMTPDTTNQTWLAMKRFFREVQIELKKTNWPTKNELTKYTIVVMVTIISVAVFLSIADWLAATFTKIVYGL